MTRTRVLTFICALCAVPGPALAWSLMDEVEVIDPNLSAELVWEMTDIKTYCESSPPNLDRLNCEQNMAENLWIGTDAVGNRYGMIGTAEPTGTYFDIFRQPAGTFFNHHIVRISKRVELVLGQPVKLFAAGAWEVDVVNGALLINLRGDCFTMDCTLENDNTEHLALIRINGLPPLLDIVQSFEPAGNLTFTLPWRPEGLSTGQTYDLYSGDLSTLADLSLATAVACNVTGGAPAGDRVSVPDTVADPAPGQGVYYVTAVSDGSARRAGRRTLGGVLRGRDAAALPPCSAP